MSLITRISLKRLSPSSRKKRSYWAIKNYADYVLEERMAKSPDQVTSFLNELLEKARPYAEKEIEELKTLAKADGIEEMQSYDHAFYAEKLRKQKFDIDDEELKPYFQLEKVQEAVFGLAKKLFGLDFVESHPDPEIPRRSKKRTKFLKTAYLKHCYMWIISKKRETCRRVDDEF